MWTGQTHDTEQRLRDVGAPFNHTILVFILLALLGAFLFERRVRPSPLRP